MLDPRSFSTAKDRSETSRISSSVRFPAPGTSRSITYSGMQPLPRPRVTSSPPSRLLVGTNSERQFGEQFVRKKTIRGVDAAEPGVAENAFQSCGAENSEPTGQFHRHVDHPPRTLH